MRFGLVEMIRFVAAISIIFWHVPGLPAGNAITWSLSFFVVLSIIFARTSPDPTVGATIRRHAAHFLLPWGIWSLFYVFLRAVGNGNKLGEFLGEFTWLDLMVGGVLPLWYLPFIFLCLSLCTTTMWLIERCDSRRLVYRSRRLLLLILIVASVFLSVIIRGSELVPFVQYAAVMPAACLGILYRVELGRDGKGPRTGRFWCILGLGLLVITSIFADWHWQPAAIAFVLVGISVGRLSTESRIPNVLGRLSWPIYLVHPMFIGFFYKIWGSWLDPFVIFVLSAVCAVVMSGVILRLPRLQGLLLHGRIQWRAKAT